MSTDGHVYIMQCGDLPRVKIGYSINPERRLRQLITTGVPDDLRVIATIPGPPALERDYHRQFADYRVRGEWFRYEGEVKQWVEWIAGKADRERELASQRRLADLRNRLKVADEDRALGITGDVGEAFTFNGKRVRLDATAPCKPGTRCFEGFVNREHHTVSDVLSGHWRWKEGFYAGWVTARRDGYDAALSGRPRPDSGSWIGASA